MGRGTEVGGGRNSANKTSRVDRDKYELHVHTQIIFIINQCITLQWFSLTVGNSTLISIETFNFIYAKTIKYKAIQVDEI